MNRYPLWKNIIIVLALVLGLLYTIPTFFGTTQAVQVSGAKATVKVEADVKDKVEQVLKAQNIPYTGLYFEKTAQGLGTVKVRVNGQDTQAKAKEAINAALNSFNKVLLANHIRTCVAEDIREGKDETIDELVVTLQKLMK